MSEVDLAGLSVLIVEDETLLRKRLTAQLERLGADVTGTDTIAGANAFLRELAFDFAVLDVQLPDGSGLDLLRQKKIPASTAAIVMTGEAGVQGAVDAMKLGALDYLAKPFEPGALTLVLNRARRARHTERIEEHRRQNVAGEVDDFFFGAALAPLATQLKKILAADLRMVVGLPPILIQGETGTGKTTVARWIHQQGPRAQQPLVEMNCSAVPDALAESELFGHERGAFTDARTLRIGLFEAANGGTLFLDELPSLSPALQAKVLKVIEDRRIRRLGGNKEIPVDVRVIAATHRDLKELIAQGLFREDLYHRLDLYRANLPPLRTRGDDIVPLAEKLAESIRRRHRLPPRKLSLLGQQRLRAYPWPGNVRELAHELERALVFEETDTLDFPQLASDTDRLVAGTAAQTAATTSPDVGPGQMDWLNPNFNFPPSGFSLDDAIHRLIQRALQQSGNNVSAAARLLGVSRDFVRYRLANSPPSEPTSGPAAGG